jgi:hypothetical protein
MRKRVPDSSAGAGRRPPPGAGVPGTTREVKTRVWVVSENGLPKPQVVHPGITDGKQTRIADTDGLDVGTQVIVGIKETVGPVAKKKRSLLPTPGPGGRPPR